MADIEITVDGGTSKRLLTGGKYCDKNILVTATGGGGEEGLTIAHGSFIPASDSKTYTVQHNLGKIPRIICAFVSDADLFSPKNPCWRFAINADFFTEGNLLYAADAGTKKLVKPTYFTVFPSNTYFSNVNENEVTVGSPALNSSYFSFKAGTEYFWFVVG